MSIKHFFIAFLPYINMFPATLVCFAAARNHLRYSKRRICATLLPLCVLMSAIIAFTIAYFSQDFSFLSLTSLIVLFVAFHRLTTLHVSQALTLYVLICTFSSFISNFSIVFDAFLHPQNNLVDFSLEATLFNSFASLLFYFLVSIPTARRGSFLIDNLPMPRVWWTASLVAFSFFIFNMSVIIRRYSTLHTNRVGAAYLTILTLMFILLLLLCVIFYFIVTALIQKADAEDKNHIFMMQEKQYDALQRYLDAYSRARHDFRQTIYTLKELSNEKDYAAIDEYLNIYMDALPQKSTRSYCKDRALNALLNYYGHDAEDHNIKTSLQIRLPEKLWIESIDLCSIIGNILENAITACSEIPEEKRFIQLIISAEQGHELYIAVSNSFSGKLKMKKDRYLSTHKGGSGIGLFSVAATAERYDGTANFTHDNNVFYSDVMLVNK